MQTIGILLDNVIMEITCQLEEGGGTGGSISLVPFFFQPILPSSLNVVLKIGDGQHTTPGLKGSYLTLTASPLPQHTTRRGRNHGMSHIRRLFLWRESPFTYQVSKPVPILVWKLPTDLWNRSNSHGNKDDKDGLCFC